MAIKPDITSVLMPPVGACRYGCGSSCAAPVTVFWLFGMVSVVFGFLGGPTAEPGISWYTVGLGFAMWGIAAIWTLLTIQDDGAARCQGLLNQPDHPIDPGDTQADRFDGVNKAH